MRFQGTMGCQSGYQLHMSIHEGFPSEQVGMHSRSLLAAWIRCSTILLEDVCKREHEHIHTNCMLCAWVIPIPDVHQWLCWAFKSHLLDRPSEKACKTALEQGLPLHRLSALQEVTCIPGGNRLRILLRNTLT